MKRKIEIVLVLLMLLLAPMVVIAQTDVDVYPYNDIQYKIQDGWGVGFIEPLVYHSEEVTVNEDFIVGGHIYTHMSDYYKSGNSDFYAYISNCPVSVEIKKDGIIVYSKNILTDSKGRFELRDVTVKESGYYEVLVFTDAFDDLTLISEFDGSEISARVDSSVLHASAPTTTPTPPISKRVGIPKIQRVVLEEQTHTGRENIPFDILHITVTNVGHSEGIFKAIISECAIPQETPYITNEEVFSPGETKTIHMEVYGFGWCTVKVSDINNPKKYDNYDIMIEKTTTSTPISTPTSTPTPTTSVPAFEATFAIVGLLAVAYLFKRRR